MSSTGPSASRNALQTADAGARATHDSDSSMNSEPQSSAILAASHHTATTAAGESVLQVSAVGEGALAANAGQPPALHEIVDPAGGMATVSTTVNHEAESTVAPVNLSDNQDASQESLHEAWQRLREEQAQLAEDKRRLAQAEQRMLERISGAEATLYRNASRIEAASQRVLEERAQLEAAMASMGAINRVFVIRDHVWEVLPLMTSTHLDEEDIIVYQLPAGTQATFQHVSRRPASTRNYLVVRKSAQLMGRKIMDALERQQTCSRFILSGNADTGKSVWANYMMKLCADRGYTVVLHGVTQKSISILQPGKPAQGYGGSLNEAMAILQQRGVPMSEILYIGDKGCRCTECPPILECVSVLISPAQRPAYKDWEKDGRAQLFWWPTWSLEECMACLPYIFLPDMTPEKLRQRYHEVGGVIRYLVRDDDGYGRYLETVNEVIQHQTGSFLFEATMSRSVAQWEHVIAKEMPADLLQIVPHDYPSCSLEGDDAMDSTPLRPLPLGPCGTLCPISAGVQGKLAEQVQQLRLDAAHAWWDAMMAEWSGTWPMDRVDLDLAFRDIFFRLSMGYAELPRLEQIPPTGRLNFGSAAHAYPLDGFHALTGETAKVNMQLENVLYRAATGTGGGAIDGWVYRRERGRMVLWLLQLTVTEARPIEIGPLAFVTKALRCGPWADAEVRLVLVVPSQSQFFRKRRAIEWPTPDRKVPSYDAATAEPLYYVPSRNQWEAAAPGSVTERTDANGLTAEPVSLAEAVAKYGRQSVAQWIWRCNRGSLK